MLEFSSSNSTSNSSSSSNSNSIRNSNNHSETRLGRIARKPALSPVREVYVFRLEKSEHPTRTNQNSLARKGHARRQLSRNVDTYRRNGLRLLLLGSR